MDSTQVASEPLLFPLPGEVVDRIGAGTARVHHAEQYRASDAAFFITTMDWTEMWIRRSAPGMWSEIAP